MGNSLQSLLHISAPYLERVRGRNFVLFSIFRNISVVRVARLLQFVVRTELHNICNAVGLRSYIPPNNRNQVALIVATILELTLAPLPVHSQFGGHRLVEIIFPSVTVLVTENWPVQFLPRCQTRPLLYHLLAVSFWRMSMDYHFLIIIIIIIIWRSCLEITALMHAVKRRRSGRNASSCCSLEDLWLFPISSDISRFYSNQIVRKEFTVINGTYKLLKWDKSGNLVIIYVSFFKRSG
jgi:hypothetical protein